MFNNEDLKRLKDYAVGYNKDVPSDWLTLHIIACLARLEAAEALAKEAENILHGRGGAVNCKYALCDDAHELEIKAALKAWRKASGR